MSNSQQSTPNQKRNGGNKISLDQLDLNKISPQQAAAAAVNALEQYQAAQGTETGETESGGMMSSIGAVGQNEPSSDADVLVEEDSLPLYLRTVPVGNVVEFDYNTALHKRIKAEAARSVFVSLPRRTIGNPSDATVTAPNPVVCSCKRGSCLKLFCPCFQAGTVCHSGCTCCDNKGECHNTNDPEFLEMRHLSILKAMQTPIMPKYAPPHQSAVPHSQAQQPSSYQHPPPPQHLAHQHHYYYHQHHAHQQYQMQQQMSSNRPQSASAKIATEAPPVPGQSRAGPIPIAPKPHSTLEKRGKEESESDEVEILTVKKTPIEVDLEETQGESGKGTRSSCNCVKTRCLKMYCDCFNAGVACGQDCGCKQCENNDLDVVKQMRQQAQKAKLKIQDEEARNAATAASVEQEDKKTKGSRCTCSKTQCLKAYCECFAANVACGKFCKCSECMNSNLPKIKELRMKSIRQRQKHADNKRARSVPGGAETPATQPRSGTSPPSTAASKNRYQGPPPLIDPDQDPLRFLMPGNTVAGTPPINGLAFFVSPSSNNEESFFSSREKTTQENVEEQSAPKTVSLQSAKERSMEYVEQSFAALRQHQAGTKRNHGGLVAPEEVLPSLTTDLTHLTTAMQTAKLQAMTLFRQMGENRWRRYTRNKRSATESNSRYDKKMRSKPGDDSHEDASHLLCEEELFPNETKPGIQDDEALQKKTIRASQETALLRSATQLIREQTRRLTQKRLDATKEMQAKKKKLRVMEEMRRVNAEKALKKQRQEAKKAQEALRAQAVMLDDRAKSAEQANGGDLASNNEAGKKRKIASKKVGDKADGDSQKRRKKDPNAAPKPRKKKNPNAQPKIKKKKDPNADPNTKKKKVTSAKKKLKQSGDSKTIKRKKSVAVEYPVDPKQEKTNTSTNGDKPKATLKVTPTAAAARKSPPSQAGKTPDNRSKVASAKGEESSRVGGLKVGDGAGQKQESNGAQQDSHPDHKDQGEQSANSKKDIVRSSDNNTKQVKDPEQSPKVTNSYEDAKGISEESTTIDTSASSATAKGAQEISDKPISSSATAKGAQKMSDKAIASSATAKGAQETAEKASITISDAMRASDLQPNQNNQESAQGAVDVPSSPEKTNSRILDDTAGSKVEEKLEERAAAKTHHEDTAGAKKNGQEDTTRRQSESERLGAN